MATTKKSTIGTRILALEAGLDFQNRESKHLIEVTRKNHMEYLYALEEIQNLKKVIAVLALVDLALCVVLVIKLW